MVRRILSWIVAAVAMLILIPLPAAGQTPRTLSFADVASVALRENLPLRAAALDVTAAEAQLAQARSGHRARMEMSASYTRTQGPGQTISFANPFGPVPPTITVTLPSPGPDLAALSVRLQYPLYAGGRVESQIALAEANLRGARAAFRRAAQQVVSTTEQTYLQALLARETLFAEQRSLGRAEEALRVAQARAAAGASPQFDVLQAQVAVAAARQAVVRAETAVQNASAGLNLLLGLPLDTSLVLAGTLERRPVSGTLEAAIGQAIRDRPEIAEWGARVDAARAAVALASSGARPNVVIRAGYDATGGSSPALGTWSVTLAVTLSLYDGGLTRERIREAEARVQQLEFLQANARRVIEFEVRQAWLALVQSELEMSAAAAGVTQAREAARVAGVRYQAGVGTGLELLGAHAALAVADLGLASAIFNQNRAWLQFRSATGVGPQEGWR